MPNNDTIQPHKTESNKSSDSKNTLQWTYECIHLHMVSEVQAFLTFETATFTPTAKSIFASPSWAATQNLNSTFGATCNSVPNLDELTVSPRPRSW